MMLNLLITMLVSQNLFAKAYGGTGNDYSHSITQTTDGGYAVAGYTMSFGAGSDDFLVLKLNPDGSLAWARTFGGTNYDWAWSIIQTTDGGYAVTGLTYSFGAGSDDPLVLKLNPDGSLAWARTFGGTNSEYARSITQTTDGAYAVAGGTLSFGAGGFDFLVLKLNSDGSLAWARTFGGATHDYARSITQTTDGGYAVAGYTQSFGAGSDDFLVLKLNPDGNYPDCVQNCSPTVNTPSPSTSTPSVGADCSPSTSSPTPTVNTPDLTITDACPPAVEESNLSRPRPGITCSPFPGGAMFISPYETPINIYAADGRLTYSGQLEKGKNRIGLETGVYIWKAGPFKGKVVIR